MDELLKSLDLAIRSAPTDVRLRFGAAVCTKLLGAYEWAVPASMTTCVTQMRGLVEELWDVGISAPADYSTHSLFSTTEERKSLCRACAPGEDDVDTSGDSTIAQELPITIWIVLDSGPTVRADRIFLAAKHLHQVTSWLSADEATEARERAIADEIRAEIDDLERLKMGGREFEVRAACADWFRTTWPDR